MCAVGLIMSHTGRRFLRILQQRGFHTTKVKFIDPSTVEEVRIPVPWGHIAGKWWGKKDVQPILAIHGRQDNAGSWDPLAELIPDDYSLLAIDLPGNGQSSHLPPFQNYHYTDFVATIQRIKKHLGFGNLDLLGHSGGSFICLCYAAIFPENVKSYFGIDYVSHCYKDEDLRARKMGEIMDKKIDQSLREHSKSKSYSWDEARDVWIKATGDSLDSKSAGVLMKRGLTRLPDGRYTFSHDRRFGDHINVLHTEQLRVLAENISCHVHLVKGLKSNFFDMSLEDIPELFSFIKKNAKSLTYSELDGKHHLHMDIPEQFVPLLLDTLKKNS